MWIRILIRLLRILIHLTNNICLQMMKLLGINVKYMRNTKIVTCYKIYRSMVWNDISNSMNQSIDTVFISNRKWLLMKNVQFSQWFSLNSSTIFILFMLKSVLFTFHMWERNVQYNFIRALLNFLIFFSEKKCKELNNKINYKATP